MQQSRSRSSIGSRFAFNIGGGGSVPTYADRAQVQAAIDAANAAGGGVVTINNNVALDGALLTRGIRLKLNGSGILSDLFPYKGPKLVIGPPMVTPVSSGHRPASVLDASAATGRTGIATLGSAALSIANDGIAYGCTGGGMPGYYTDLNALTWEFCLVTPVTLPGNTGIIGFNNGSIPDPFCFATYTDSSTGVIAYQLTSGGVRVETFPLNQALPFNDICWQINLLTGHSWIFKNGVRVSNVTIPTNSHFRRQSGYSPFGIGFTNNFPPLGVGTPCANVTIHGNKISADVRYIDSDSQALIRGGTLNHYARYFGSLPGDPAQIGFLPLTDPLAPTVQVAYPNGNGLAFWCPNNRSGFASYTTVEGLTFGGGVQPSILTAEQLYTRVEGCTIPDALGAVQTLPCTASMNYMLKLINNELGGYDAALRFQNQIYKTSGTNVVGTGITTVGEVNCTSIHENMFIPGPGGNTRTAFEFHGGIIRLQDIIYDDESGGLLSSYIEVSQGFSVPGRLVVDGLDVSLGSVPLLDLIGLGSGSGWATTQIDVKNCSAFGFQIGQPATILRATGPADAFKGTFNASGLAKQGVSGTTDVTVTSD